MLSDLTSAQVLNPIDCRAYLSLPLPLLIHIQGSLAIVQVEG